MRLAYLTSSYPAISHTFIAREIVGLRARGHEVVTFSIRPTAEEHLLTEEDREASRTTPTILPASVPRLLAAHLRGLITRPRAYVETFAHALTLGTKGPRDTLWNVFYFGEAILFWHMMRRARVQHVHVHFANVAANVALLASRFGTKDGLTWSFTMHGQTEFDDVSRFALPEKAREAAFVVCIGEYCRSQLMRFLGDEDSGKLDIVRCGVDPAVFAPVERSPTDHLRVACVGRLVADKGQAVLLEACALLRDRGVHARIHLIGDGPERLRLERLAEQLDVVDRIVFHGSVGQDAIRQHYAAADVFCLPSFAEGVPVVLMEAMAMEVPVVSTAVQGIAELVENGINGRLVRPSRADLLADALQEVIDQPQRVREMAREGRRKVQRDYSIEANVARLERIFEGHLAGREASLTAPLRKRAGAQFT